jgi:ribosomal protein L16 Arg81 hydroxylase
MSIFDHESFLESVRNRQHYYFGNVINTADFNLFKYIKLLDSHPNEAKTWNNEKENISLTTLESRGSSPNFIKDIISELRDVFTINKISCHSFSGFTETSQSFKIHKDPMDVLYLQGVGSVVWSVWESIVDEDNILPEQGKCIFQETFTPGDLIWIPRRTYHHVKPLEARVGFSFGVENNPDPSTYI